MIPGAAKVLEPIFQALENHHRRTPQFSFPNPSSVVVLGILCVWCVRTTRPRALVQIDDDAG